MAAMKKSTAATLRQWKIVAHLKEEFLQSVKLFCTTGDPENKIALMVTTSDKVYAIVWNAVYFSAFGISGSATPESKILPQRVKGLRGKSISGICIGNGGVDYTFFFAWASDGSVYSWGYNGNGELGNGETSRTFASPALVAGLAGKKIIVVRAGDYHALALTDNGEVYVWGYKGDGSIGNGSGGNAGQTIPIPVEISASSHCKVVDISCGPRFCAALTESGEIFTWGDNSVGQMGNGNTTNSATPIKLSNFETFSKVVCGKEYILALTTSNVVYGWGINTSCELGISDKANRYAPTALPVKHVVDISAHFTSGLSICQTIDGKVHVWGNTHFGCIENPMEIQAACETLEDALAYFSVEQTMPKMIQFAFAQKNKAGEEAKGMLDFLKDAFDVEESADLVFEFPDAEAPKIYAHRTVLEIRNPKLAKIIKHLENQFETPEGALEKLTVRIDHAKYPIYRAFLLYLYTDKFELPYEGIMDLMKLAQAYGEPKLREECGIILIKKLSPETAPLLYAAAIQVKDNVLKETAVKYITDNYKEVVRSGKLETSGLDTPAILTLLTEFAIRKL